MMVGKLIVYNALRTYGPCSARDLADRLFPHQEIWEIQPHRDAVWGKLNTLEKQKYVRRVGRDETGTITWGVIE